MTMSWIRLLLLAKTVSNILSFILSYFINFMPYMKYYSIYTITWSRMACLGLCFWTYCFHDLYFDLKMAIYRPKQLSSNTYITSYLVVLDGITYTLLYCYQHNGMDSNEYIIHLILTVTTTLLCWSNKGLRNERCIMGEIRCVKALVVWMDRTGV
jgi:hypothetical protein